MAAERLKKLTKPTSYFWTMAARAREMIKLASSLRIADTPSGLTHVISDLLVCETRSPFTKVFVIRCRDLCGYNTVGEIG